MRKNTNSNSAIELKKVSKSYDAGVAALRDISLSVKKGEFVCIVGPSGCGKSTLLKLIAGLDKTVSGTVSVPGRVSLVFQDAALLPWLTVEENIVFGLRALKRTESDIARAKQRLLAMMGLRGYGMKYPRELSGGQRQRVGIARALAVEPAVLLLDEPFSALDVKTTDELHQDILRMWQETKITILMVSHLIEEAVSLADRVILMKKGLIEETFPVSFPYPRREQTVAFGELVQTIRKEFLS